MIWVKTVGPVFIPVGTGKPTLRPNREQSSTLGAIRSAVTYVGHATGKWDSIGLARSLAQRDRVDEGLIGLFDIVEPCLT